MFVVVVVVPFLLLTITNISNAYVKPSELRHKIGTPGLPWGTKEKNEWFNSRVYHRSYQEDVVKKLQAGFEGFAVHQYGTIHVNKEYPLYVVKSNDWDEEKVCVLITGGVHGYETSGVQGAILFLQRFAKYFNHDFNILVAPCVNPWGYETMERWNAQAMDPNRSFGREVTNESKALMQYLQHYLTCAKWLCHLDLHETTDFDKFEFRPAKLARDGEISNQVGTIPDGFYLVTDSTITNPQTTWHKAMIDSVRQVTHIAPVRSNALCTEQQLRMGPDGTIIGEQAVQEGVIAVPVPALGMCIGMTTAKYAATTEIYPDSPKVTLEQCNQAQMMCIKGGLEYITQQDKGSIPPLPIFQKLFGEME
mmetsp:Transcript_2905/g.4370  ORF Transcript_2905/g.4370 Transcript_2905/m.4370 type:complete len:364 (-) Transcript_2905:52-1143(-)